MEDIVGKMYSGKLQFFLSQRFTEKSVSRHFLVLEAGFFSIRISEFWIYGRKEEQTKNLF